MSLPGKGDSMHFRVALLACASVCVLLATAAAAEPPIGSRVGERTEKQAIKDQRDAVHIAHEFAGCVLATRGSAARDFLNARSEEEVANDRKRLGGEEECFANFDRNDIVEGVEVSYPGDILRGDLAEELVKRQHAAAAQLQPLPIQKVYSRPWYAFTGRDVSVDEMATCVADTNPAAILNLLDTAPYSDSEGAAFSSLIPYLGPCLRAGTKLAGAREPLRAALAEALYQRLANPAEDVSAPAPATVQANSK